MGELVFTATTGLLMVLMFNGGLTLIGKETVPRRRLPWFAAGLATVALAGVVLQLSWDAAFGALDDDPAKSGWWRVVTAVFMQNGGVAGTVYNLLTLAAVAALAEWFWGGPLMLTFFAAGIFLPGLADSLLGATSHSTDPRNFAGSSGATYFLAATLAAALLIHSRGRARKELLLALATPTLGLAMWLAQENGHGLVAVYGFALATLVLLLGRRVLRTNRDLERAPRRTVGSLAQAVKR